MTPFFVAILLLGLSSMATATNLFSQVFEWPDGLDYEWPSEANRTQEDETLEPDDIVPLYMAAYGPKIFLSLKKYGNIPMSLVSLPTRSASSAPPKLTPFPSWDMHENENWEKCNKIEEAKGLEVDSIGRLWVLDEASSKSNCRAKLWIFDLNSNKTELVHHFYFHDPIHDLVLDETPNGTFAYISRQSKQHIVVFSLEQNESWKVNTSGLAVSSIALSPKNQEPRTLYLSEYESSELYSISVAALRNGTRTANPELIGNWTAKQSYRMLLDNHGTMYAAFQWENYTSSWNSSQPFQEQRFYEAADLLPFYWQFTFSLGQSGSLWMMVFDEYSNPRYALLKAEIGAKSYIFEDLPEESILWHLFGIILSGSIVFSVVIFWRNLRQKRINSLSRIITKELTKYRTTSPTMTFIPRPLSPDLNIRAAEKSKLGTDD
ncbi:major royal jelly protein 1-like [Cloeon dipterum]|uniref:major royal jelly protein 1-like n=1 Tax=Cloeon dipterum TaxID=197152 RepID=UPI00321FFB61